MDINHDNQNSFSNYPLIPPINQMNEDQWVNMIEGQSQSQGGHFHTRKQTQ